MRTGVNARAVTIHILAYGVFDSPFLVKVIPTKTKKGMYVCVELITIIYIM